MAKVLWIWKEQLVEFGFIRILLWLSHESTSSLPQEKVSLWLSVFMSNSLKNPSQLFIQPYLILTSLDGHRSSKKLYPWDFQVFFSMYNVNLRVISTLVISSETMANFSWNAPKPNSIKNCLQWTHKHGNTTFTCLPSALHLFWWDWNHQITLTRAGRRGNIRI